MEKKTTTSNVKDAQVSPQVDYTLCYGKTPLAKIKQRITTSDMRSYPESDAEGNYRTTVIEKKDSGSYKRDTMKYSILGHSPRPGKRWQIGEETAIELERKGRFFWDGEKIKLKIYDFEDENSFSAQPNLLLDKGGSDTGSTEVNQELFGVPELFDNPKPVDLIKHFIEISSSPGDLILDFFSGSATTAHAVLDLNAKTNATSLYKYIMVQLPELVDANTEAARSGFNSISEIGKERIRRAAIKIQHDQGVDIDYGFRVFRLDESNMQDVYYHPHKYSQVDIDLLANNIKPDRSDLDLLVQVMLDWGLPLDLKIQKIQIGGKTVFDVANNALLACFDKDIDEKFAREVAVVNPLRIVFMDASFQDDTAKTNVKQLLKQLSPETEMKVL